MTAATDIQIANDCDSGHSLQRMVGHPSNGQKISENSSCKTQQSGYCVGMKTQTTSVRKNQVEEYASNGWTISANQLPADQNPLGLVAMEKQVPANTMLTGNNLWWKL